MATNFPASTGDVLTAAAFNQLVAFSIESDKVADYTAVLADQYQVLIPMNKATAVDFKIPTNASIPFEIGTVITVLNKGVGDCTISAVTSGTTTVLSSAAVPASPVLSQYGSAACIQTAVDVWYVVGSVA
jgi:hypothetical protein